jgi:hypothetical protein
VAFRTGGEEDLLVPCLLLRGYSPLDKEDKEGEEEEGEGASAPEAPTPASTLLIYCHANSEDLGSIYACAHWISRMLGVHVLVPEYPGPPPAPAPRPARPPPRSGSAPCCRERAR